MIDYVNVDELSQYIDDIVRDFILLDKLLV